VTEVSTRLRHRYATVVVAPGCRRTWTSAPEWVGTTTGNVNAQIYPKIQGYLIDRPIATEVR
jgi:hypothetical protein